MSQNCIFCRIIAGEIPANIVYEDMQYLAFHDIHPKAKTHLLIIPKAHIHSVQEMHTDQDHELVGGLFSVAQKIAQQHQLEGYQLKVHVGPKWGQEVMHVHMHLLSDISL